MKFIITLQTQILGSFYFAQVKKIFCFLGFFLFFFFSQRDKGSNGWGWGRPPACKGESPAGLQQEAPTGLPQSPAEQWEPKTQDFLCKWAGVSLDFVFR